MKSAVHFGAGNIGRGFIGLLVHQAGYRVTFVDVLASVVDAIIRLDLARCSSPRIHP